jgi:hypothetical protein
MFLPVMFLGRNFVGIFYFPMHTSLLLIHSVLRQLAGTHDGFWTQNLRTARGELTLRRGNREWFMSIIQAVRFVSLFKDGLWFSEALFSLPTISVLYYMSRWKEKWFKSVLKGEINALRYPVALTGRSRWPRSLRRGSAVARLLGLRVRIPLVAWMSVSGEGCCQVDVFAYGWSLIQRSPTECDMSECDIETSTMRMPRPARFVETKVASTGTVVLVLKRK